jgi:hypothetical protein
MVVMGDIGGGTNVVLHESGTSVVCHGGCRRQSVECSTSIHVCRGVRQWWFGGWAMAVMFLPSPFDVCPVEVVVFISFV